MRTRGLALFGWIAVTACAAPSEELERAELLVMCHNSNCAGPVDPSRDDRLEALAESLALRHEGRAVIDGIEIDSVWLRAEERCIYVHDLYSGGPRPDYLVAARTLADYLRREPAPSWNGQRFYTKMELKSFVGEADGEEVHSPEEARRHAACVLEATSLLTDAAEAVGTNVVVIYESEDTALLEAIASHPAFPGRQPTPRTELWFAAHYALPRPPGMDFEVVAINQNELRDGDYNEYRQDGTQLMLWMFDATSETLGMIDFFRPEFANTNEALLVRRWDRRDRS